MTRHRWTSPLDADPPAHRRGVYPRGSAARATGLSRHAGISPGINPGATVRGVYPRGNAPSTITWLLRCGCMIAVFVLFGCSGSSWPTWPQPGARAGGGVKGEPWTILCVESYDEGRRAYVSQLAEGLRRAAGFNQRLVRVEHRDEVSRLYYGRYGRQPDRNTGMLDVPPAMTNDLTRLRQLALGVERGAYPFLLAMPVPVETVPTRRDPPEWDLGRSDGDYSLLIAVFTGVEDRRAVAVEYVRRLREQGDEAYYYHDPTRSHVCVGSFNGRTVRQLPNGVMRVLDPDYRRYKSKYPYYTLDGQYVLQVRRDTSGRVVAKTRQRSRLVEVSR